MGTSSSEGGPGKPIICKADRAPRSDPYTFVRTWQVFCYTAFVSDACTKKIAGWAVAASMRTEDLPLQAVNHAAWQANCDLSELVHHSDRGSQPGFNGSPQHRLTEPIVDGR